MGLECITNSVTRQSSSRSPLHLLLFSDALLALRANSWWYLLKSMHTMWPITCKDRLRSSKECSGTGRVHRATKRSLVGGAGYECQQKRKQKQHLAAVQWYLKRKAGCRKSTNLHSHQTTITNETEGSDFYHVKSRLEAALQREPKESNR